MKPVAAIALAALVIAQCVTLAALGADTRVVVIVGPSNHPPGTHEVAAGGRLIAWALENMANVPGVKADLFYGWPRDRQPLDSAAAIVFIGDIFPPQRMDDRAAVLKDVGRLMQSGTGIVCIHYATGLRAEDVAPDGAHPLLGWLGGYFATRCLHHQSVAKVFQSVKVSPAAPEHPVSRGWRAFTLDDEPYYNNYFGPDGNHRHASLLQELVQRRSAPLHSQWSGVDGETRRSHGRSPDSGARSREVRAGIN
jgi:hypothetical protein